MNGKKSILIVGLSTQIGITLVRSFGKRGFKVFGISDKINTCFFSKYLTKGYIYSNFEEEEKFIDYILKILDRHKIDYVISFLDVFLTMLNKNRIKIEKKSKLLLPPMNILENALDKRKTMKMAEELKIPIPKTIFVNTPEDLLKCKNLRFPLVVKPGSRVFHSYKQRKNDFKRDYFHDFAKLQNFFNNFDSSDFPPMIVQEYCSGDEYGIPIFMYKGKCITCMQYKIIRTYPVKGGVSVFQETQEVDPELEEYSIKLLQKIKWEGVAELDYIKDHNAGKYRLLEINGRFWGPISLAIAAGIDFPHMAIKSAEGLNEFKMLNFKVGMHGRNLSADTAWLSDVLFDRVPADEFGSNTSKSKAIKEYIKAFFPPVKYDFQSIDDPIPSLIDLLLSVKILFSGIQSDTLAVRSTVKI
jgi:predicted ATP-grasp superfamily ATP-dependent carboligase